MSIQYKVEENQLTTPPSYTVRFVPRGSAVLKTMIRNSYSGRVADVLNVSIES